MHLLVDSFQAGNWHQVEVETRQTSPGIKEGPGEWSAGDRGQSTLGGSCSKHIHEKGPNFGVGGAGESRMR